ncbi:hypothetical protein RFI_32549 [Reticulomyxa filosa]|uniref:Uncharacterized protein n=1 Tax=Reticulomyxa filosa TaxID=46433 RepID=X6LSI2_RETFI|nr:hypothetical protein RFI_32549 [Reticulomyxa filosa]|eukprot:ETO04848.1 hypothetical protein RFI_32549 [Reticulomyxa filosa]
MLTNGLIFSLKFGFSCQIMFNFCFINQTKKGLFKEKVQNYLKNFININDMGNKTITSERETEQTKQMKHLITLKELPTLLFQSQCVLYKNEIIICGGLNQRGCYSYNTLKNEYKIICEYPRDVTLWGYCVVKLVDNNKERNHITLLSFGSDRKGKNKHTLMMKYVSVWSNKSNELNKLNEFNNYNEWIPFTDNQNNPIIIGRDNDDYYFGARALIGGINNNLLFITYFKNNISVFNLNTFKFIKHNNLPTDNAIFYHGFISNSENGKNKKIYQMLLFCKDTGLSIEYNEDKNILNFINYMFVRILHHLINMHMFVSMILYCFGGDGRYVQISIQVFNSRKKWMTFRNTLPNQLCDCVAILSEDNRYVHIIGGVDDERKPVSTHMKTEVSEWLNKEEIKRIPLNVEKEEEKNEMNVINI